MYTVYNILSLENLDRLVKMIDYEIQTNLCLQVPKYQSYNDMHIKYKNDEVFDKIFEEIDKTNLELFGKIQKIKMCWFNVCKKDSNFRMHTHRGVSLTGVFYVKGCKNEGTIFELNNTRFQVLSDDNSIILFNPSTRHTVPSWNGHDRYTIAFDFI